MVELTKALHASVTVLEKKLQKMMPSARCGKNLSSGVPNRELYSGPMPPIMAPMLSVSHRGPSIERR
ncbi:hypothetical protein D9M69_564970 [compost metagenome]